MVRWEGRGNKVTELKETRGQRKREGKGERGSKWKTGYRSGGGAGGSERGINRAKECKGEEGEEGVGRCNHSPF